MNFVEGAVWSEARAGTNAPGTALIVGRPVQVFAAEHYNEVVHPWSCAAAPIRAPGTGRILGVVDITGGEGVASRHALALVRATALAAEAELPRTVPKPVSSHVTDGWWPVPLRQSDNGHGRTASSCCVSQFGNCHASANALSSFSAP